MFSRTFVYKTFVPRYMQTWKKAILRNTKMRVRRSASSTPTNSNIASANSW